MTTRRSEHINERIKRKLANDFPIEEMYQTNLSIGWVCGPVDVFVQSNGQVSVRVTRNEQEDYHLVLPRSMDLKLVIQMVASVLWEECPDLTKKDHHALEVYFPEPARRQRGDNRGIPHR